MLQVPVSLITPRFRPLKVIQNQLVGSAMLIFFMLISDNFLIKWRNQQ